MLRFGASDRAQKNKEDIHTMYFLQKLVLTFLMLLSTRAFADGPKVTVDWGSRSTSTFSVTADNLEKFVETLLEAAKKSNYPGAFEWDLGYVYTKNNDDGVVIAVLLKPTSKTTLPYWGKGTSLKGKCKSVYEDLIKTLEEHENEHKEMFEKSLSILKSNIESLEKPTVKELEELIKDYRAEEKENREKFDDQTNHGTKDVEFTLPEPESCK